MLGAIISETPDEFFDDSTKFSDEITKYNLELYDVAIKDESIKNSLKARGVNF